MPLALAVVDKKVHPLDPHIAKCIQKVQGTYCAAVYLMQFGWSVDAARCILLSKGVSDRK